MTATITKTIKSSGGDYSSLSAWEAAQQGNLVSLDEVHVGECYAFEDTTDCTIDGSTTDSTRYMKVTVATGNRHNGKWSTSGYRMNVATANRHAIDNRDDYTWIEWVQLVTNGTASNQYGPCSNINTGFVLRNSILAGGGGAAGSADGQNLYDIASSTVENCVIYAGHLNGILFGGGAATHNIRNVTCVANGSYGFQRSNGTVNCTNCYSGGNTTDDWNGTITCTTCKHSSATSQTGSTANTAYSTANFTNVTAGSEDLHLPSGSALIDAGTDLSGNFTDDIDGDARSGTWDIGADERVTAGGFNIAILQNNICGNMGFDPCGGNLINA